MLFRSDYPNQVNNVLGFPYIFRGALDVRATTINEDMKIAAAKAIAQLAREDVPDEVAAAYRGVRPKFGPEYIIPVPFDPRLISEIPAAVAKAAMESGVARRPIVDMEAYRQSLSEERRTLLDRYTLVDSALKVVGIGSVGTRCYVLLLLSEENHPLILQAKEARHSVLEPYTQPSRYENQGERVVMGQRLMQSSSDIFLGWVRGPRGYDNYVRQLRDMKLSAPVEGGTPPQLQRYAE